MSHSFRTARFQDLDIDIRVQLRRRNEDITLQTHYNETFIIRLVIYRRDRCMATLGCSALHPSERNSSFLFRKMSPFIFPTLRTSSSGSYNFVLLHPPPSEVEITISLLYITKKVLDSITIFESGLATFFLFGVECSVAYKL